MVMVSSFKVAVIYLRWMKTPHSAEGSDERRQGGGDDVDHSGSNSSREIEINHNIENSV